MTSTVQSTPSPSGRGSGANRAVLAINGGSSSLRFALFETGEALMRRMSGKVERIGLPGTAFLLHEPRKEPERRTIDAPDHVAAVNQVLERIEERGLGPRLMGVGHRVVHGGLKYNRPQPVTSELMAELRRLSPYDPEHLPAEIELIQTVQERYPHLPQVACFDTAFHHGMPRVARLLPIPRRFEAQGVQRYGFHGLSYEFLMEELARVAGPDAARGRVILAHLGNGASLAAVRLGQCLDTSMSFTPASGVAMSTRSGDLDPGLVCYLARTEQMTPEKFHHMINRESGLLGVSETSPDMRDLLAREAKDPRAAEAVALFCYHIRKWIGAFAAVLDGLDTLIFSGGIGENSCPVRERICEGLRFLGIEVDPEGNASSAGIISTVSSRVAVRVMRTDEEQMIARATVRLLGSGEKGSEL